MNLDHSVSHLNKDHYILYCFAQHPNFFWTRGCSSGWVLVDAAVYGSCVMDVVGTLLEGVQSARVCPSVCLCIS